MVIVVVMIVVRESDVGVNHPALFRLMRVAERFLRQPAEKAGQAIDRRCRASHVDILWMPQS